MEQFIPKLSAKRDKTVQDEPKWTEEQILKVAADGELDISGYSMDEILLGMPVQAEHGSEAGDADVTHDDPLETLKIVIGHLKEFEKYYSEVLLPAQAKVRERDVSEGVFMHKVPMFEDYTNDNFRMSDWYMGASGDLYASDGRAMRDFNHENDDSTPDSGDVERLTPYMELVSGGHRLFRNMTEPHRNKNKLLFGFSGPRIKNGPYAGSESWWTFWIDSEKDTRSLLNDVTGQIYEVADENDFRKLLDELVKDLYVKENKETWQEKGEYYKAAAGILAICETTGRMLLCLRKPEEGDRDSNVWATPGGMLNDKELKENVEIGSREGALREFKEEIGEKDPFSRLMSSYVHMSADGSFKYYNFIGIVPEEFEPKLNHEHTDAKWFSVADLKLIPRDRFHFGLKLLFANDQKTITEYAR